MFLGADVKKMSIINVYIVKKVYNHCK